MFVPLVDFFLFLTFCASVWYNFRKITMASQEVHEQLQQLLAANAALQKQLEQSEKEAKVCRVAVKLPTFWADKPAVWFAQVEAQFQIANIVGDTTKYNYVVGHLDQRLAGEVEDLITNPPAEGKYEKLKELLIQRLSVSQEKRVRQLLSDEELGDRKPSQFLRHLRSLAGSTLTDDNIIRQLWLRRLPHQAQAILAAQADLNLDKVSELADKIVELAPAPAVVCSTSTSATTLSMATLAQQLQEVSNQVAALSRQQRRPSRDRSTSSSRGSKICWYHRRWGQKAARCISPCTWKPENKNSNQ